MHGTNVIGMLYTKGRLCDVRKRINREFTFITEWWYTCWLWRDDGMNDCSSRGCDRYGPSAVVEIAWWKKMVIGLRRFCVIDRSYWDVCAMVVGSTWKDLQRHTRQHRTHGKCFVLLEHQWWDIEWVGMLLRKHGLRLRMSWCFEIRRKMISGRWSVHVYGDQMSSTIMIGTYEWNIYYILRNGECENVWGIGNLYERNLDYKLSFCYGAGYLLQGYLHEWWMDGLFGLYCLLWNYENTEWSGYALWVTIVIFAPRYPWSWKIDLVIFRGRASKYQLGRPQVESNIE